MKENQKSLTIARIIIAMDAPFQDMRARLIIKNKQGKVLGAGSKSPGFCSKEFQCVAQKAGYATVKTRELEIWKIGRRRNQGFWLTIQEDQTKHLLEPHEVSDSLYIKRQDVSIESTVSFYQGVVEALEPFFNFDIGVKERLNVIQSTTRDGDCELIGGREWYDEYLREVIDEATRPEDEQWGCPTPTLTISRSGDLHIRLETSKEEELPPKLETMQSYLKKHYKILKTKTMILKSSSSEYVRELSVHSTDVIKLTQGAKDTKSFLPLKQAIWLYLKWLCDKENRSELLGRGSNDREIAAALLKDGRILFTDCVFLEHRPPPPGVVLSIKECSKKLSGPLRRGLNTMKEQFQALPFVEPGMYPERGCKVLEQLVAVRLQQDRCFKTFVLCCVRRELLLTVPEIYQQIALFFLNKWFSNSLLLAQQTDNHSTRLKASHHSSMMLPVTTVSQDSLESTDSNTRFSVDSDLSDLGTQKIIIASSCGPRNNLSFFP